LRPEQVFDTRSTTYLTLDELGLTPGDPSAVQQAHHWINTHFRAIHHNTPFLHLPQVLDIATKVFASPQPLRRNGDLFGGYYGYDQSNRQDDALDADDLALLYAVLALGSLREQTYDSYRKTYRTLDADDTISPASNRSAPSFRSRLAGQSLARMAQDELEQIETPSETAVQALFLMHTFISNTSMSRRSRDYVARAVMMSHEIGLNRRLAIPTRLDKRSDRYGARRRAILYLYVCFSDV
jgi:hypothetical protein